MATQQVTEHSVTSENRGPDYLMKVEEHKSQQAAGQGTTMMASIPNMTTQSSNKTHRAPHTGITMTEETKAKEPSNKTYTAQQITGNSVTQGNKTIQTF